jgi:hypothetical protein
MTSIKELEVVRLLQPAEADIIGEQRIVVLPAGSRGTVQAVWGPATNPVGYTVEFTLVPLKEYALADVAAELVESTGEWPR